MYRFPFFMLSYLCFIKAVSLNADEPLTTTHKTDPTVTRAHNIELMRNVLKKNEYTGYDILIISSTSKEEADYQQQMLEKLFAGTSKSNGQGPIILSVVDSTEGGQLIGSVFTWLEAEKMLREKFPHLMQNNESLISYIRTHRLKAASFHNGGKGERCSPLTQSLGNSRGSQKLVGSIKNALNEEIDLDIISSVILQCSSFAITNPGTHFDTFWTSQIAFGSFPHDKIVRSGFEIDKFLVGFSKNNLIPQNIADFGTAALNDMGRMTAFYGNKRFATRKGSEYVVDHAKIDNELLSKGSRVAYDFGCFAVNLEMWENILDYWNRKVLLENQKKKVSAKRDIDPHFIQPCIRFLFAIHDLADRELIDNELPSPSTLKTKEDIKKAVEEFNLHLETAIPHVHNYIWEDIINESDAKKKLEGTVCLEEAIEFYLLYRNTPALADLKKIFGFIDLGNETQWFRYRRPIDIMNEKFEMLTDLIGSITEVQLDGSILIIPANKIAFQRSKEARLMRGITDDRLSHFTIEGKAVTLNLEEIKQGKWIEGVYVKNSIIQNSDLTKGSIVVDSVINHVLGKVIAHHSYLESSTSPLIDSSRSIVHQMKDTQPVKAVQEVISDVFKTKLSPPYHGRMRAPIGFDPKGMPIYKKIKILKDNIFIDEEVIDETIKYFIETLTYNLNGAKELSDRTARTEDGRFTFDEVREIEPLKLTDHSFRDSIQLEAKKAVYESRKGPWE